jgi:hypothetical protein
MPVVSRTVVSTGRTVRQRHLGTFLIVMPEGGVLWDLVSGGRGVGEHSVVHRTDT